MAFIEEFPGKIAGSGASPSSAYVPPRRCHPRLKGSGGKEEKRRFFVHRSLTRFLITPGFSSSCFWRGVVGSCCLGDSSTVFARVQYSAFVTNTRVAQKPARNKSKAALQIFQKHAIHANKLKSTVELKVASCFPLLLPL